jgi:hypothetical protein
VPVFRLKNAQNFGSLTACRQADLPLLMLWITDLPWINTEKDKKNNFIKVPTKIVKKYQI